MGTLVEREWPVHMKKNVEGQIDTQYAHNKKELQAWADQGYSENLGAVGGVEYPRLLYRMFNGNVETIAGQNKAHEDELKNDGYGRKPLAQPYRSESAGTAAASAQDDSRISAVEDQVAKLAEDVGGMKNDIQAILAALTGNADEKPSSKKAS